LISEIKLLNVLKVSLKIKNTFSQNSYKITKEITTTIAITTQIILLKMLFLVLAGNGSSAKTPLG
jgi:hypothetical protein